MAKVYSTVPDKAGGDTYTEVMWDTYTRDNVNNLMSPAMCRVTKSGATAITTAVDTAAPFDTEALDTDGMHDNVTNNTRITPTTAGLYVVSSNGDFALNATGSRYGALRLNNTTYLAIAHLPSATASISGWLNPTTLREFNGSTDYVELRVWQNSGGNLNYPTDLAACSFQAVWVGRTS